MMMGGNAWACAAACLLLLLTAAGADGEVRVAGWEWELHLRCLLNEWGS